MAWDDLIAWFVYSSPLDGKGDDGDNWQAHPGRAVLMMLIGIALLGGVAWLVWLLG